MQQMLKMAVPVLQMSIFNGLAFPDDRASGPDNSDSYENEQ